MARKDFTEEEEEFEQEEEQTQKKQRKGKKGGKKAAPHTSQNPPAYLTGGSQEGLFTGAHLGAVNPFANMSEGKGRGGKRFPPGYGARPPGW